MSTLTCFLLTTRVLKKDLDKRLTELRVLEHRFSEESEAYKKKRYSSSDSLL